MTEEEMFYHALTHDMELYTQELHQTYWDLISAGKNGEVTIDEQNIVCSYDDTQKTFMIFSQFSPHFIILMTGIGSKQVNFRIGNNSLCPKNFSTEEVSNIKCELQYIIENEPTK
ncbi:hypothetical protein [Gluconobacter frateurii]|uniref:Uncharacterized protein n=1 Tax=Gluconobacter frateurii NRIC 0228 TaxID=1307946 RepID=A0ABQ0QFQ9_9PROT|nr:hypothetical protein [Gluconobacter frateurii]GBR17493.1 hypothetical protein AA0228_3041 [Gluconobacter frateurii NRIC 0228]GLP89619.1 hypothetical protein GCM10007868_06940 [Gluconobacter frateurii]